MNNRRTIKLGVNIDHVVTIRQALVTAYPDLIAIVKEVESVLSDCFAYDKINYLMLMMVDPEVHYHIIPRYSHEVKFKEVKFSDFGWPGLPKFSEINNISKNTFGIILLILMEKFSKNV